MERQVRTLVVHGGWEARKTPAVAEVFFLDFPLYRTSQELARVVTCCRVTRITSGLPTIGSEPKRWSFLSRECSVRNKRATSGNRRCWGYCLVCIENPGIVGDPIPVGDA